MAMSVEERRRLIYELLIEAKNVKDQSKKVQDELLSIGKVATETKTILKEMFLPLAGAAAVIEIGGMISQTVKLNEQLKVIGITGKGASQALKDIQNTAFATGQSMDSVSNAYQQAVQVIQQIGGSQKDAAKLADAFTRVMVAQGKTAADAAAQLDALQFAIGRGSLKSREFQTLLKENNILQQAAQEALHATTGELLAMAEAGQISGDEIRKILARFEQLADQQKIGITLDRITESLKTLIATLVQAAAESSGLNEALSESKLPGWVQTVIDDLRALIEVATGGARAVLNIIQLAADAFAAVGKIWTDEGREELRKAFLEDWEDLKKAMEAVLGIESTPPDPDGIAGENTAARIRATAEDLKRLNTDTLAAIKKEIEALQPLQEFEDWARETALKIADALQEGVTEGLGRSQKRDEVLEKQADDIIDQITNGGKKAVAEREKFLKEIAEKDAKQQEDMWAEQAKRDEEQRKKREEQQREAAQRVREFTDVVGGELEKVFTLQQTNARAFFASIARGFAQILASRAAQKVSEMLAGLFTPTFHTGMNTGIFGAGGFGGTTGSSIPGDFAMDERFFSARGNVFANGELLKFARGGVVSQPTVFPMASGLGLMGEAGAEAVMPLKRMSNGNLGVASAMPAVTIVNQTGVAARGRVSRSNESMQVVLEAAELGAQLAEGRMTRSIRSGYGPTAMSLQRTYALRRGGGG